jgi:hypothetical protein
MTDMDNTEKVWMERGGVTMFVPTKKQAAYAAQGWKVAANPLTVRAKAAAADKPAPDKQAAGAKGGSKAGASKDDEKK